MTARRDGYRSFTIRTDVGGAPTEADKRVAAYQHGGVLPDWTAQGYISATGKLHHAGIISTRELIKAFVEATGSGKRRDLVNSEDGHKFWAAYWDTLRKCGNATTLKLIEPSPAPTFVMSHRQVDMTNPDCWHPTLHRTRWVGHPVTGRLVCQVCHPMPGTS